MNRSRAFLKAASLSIYWYFLPGMGCSTCFWWFFCFPSLGKGRKEMGLGRSYPLFPLEESTEVCWEGESKKLPSPLFPKGKLWHLITPLFGCLRGFVVKKWWAVGWLCSHTPSSKWLTTFHSSSCPLALMGKPKSSISDWCFREAWKRGVSDKFLYSWSFPACFWWVGRLLSQAAVVCEMLAAVYESAPWSCTTHAEPVHFRCCWNRFISLYYKAVTQGDRDVSFSRDLPQLFLCS